MQIPSPTPPAALMGQLTLGKLFQIRGHNIYLHILRGVVYG